MNKKVKKFNLRVYGLLIYNNKVLITDEHRGGMLMTKFPGGGLEKGEGIADCLIREFQEEISMNITVEKFFYINDFLQLSNFDPTSQLFSFYYIVQTNELHKIPEPVDMQKLKPNEQGFRWLALDAIQVEDFTFPIDRKVAELLKKKQNF